MWFDVKYCSLILLSFLWKNNYMFRLKVWPLPRVDLILMCMESVCINSLKNAGNCKILLEIQNINRPAGLSLVHINDTQEASGV